MAQSQELSVASVNDYLNTFSTTPENYRKIFVGGLSWSTTEDRLQQYFEKFGAPVDRLAIMRDKATGRSRGFGFVSFMTIEGLELVVAARHVIDGRKIECKKAIPKGEIASQIKKVFVGGLPLTLEEPALRQYFEKFGRIEECTIMTDGLSNRSRGFAFVSFFDDEVLQRVLETPHALDGKCFEVKKARSKQEVQTSSSIPAHYPHPYFGFPYPMAYPGAPGPNGFIGYPPYFPYPFDPHQLLPNHPPAAPSEPPKEKEAPKPIVTEKPLPEVRVTPAESNGLNRTEAKESDPGSVEIKARITERSWKPPEEKKVVRTTSASDVAPAEHVKKLNRTVSASVGDKALARSSSSFYVSKTLPVKTEVVGIDSKKPGMPSSARVLKRGAKSTVSITPPKSAQSPGPIYVPSAGPQRKSTPEVSQKIVTQPIAHSFQPQPKTPTQLTVSSPTQPPPPALQRKSMNVPVFVDLSENLSVLEKDLARLQRQSINRTKSATDIPAPKSLPVMQTKATDRKRGSPNSPETVGSNNADTDPIRHLDLNWRNGGGKRPDDTIFKYFQVIPTPQKV